MERQTIEMAADGCAALAPATAETAPAGRGAATGALLCLISICCAQFGSALTAPLIADYGVAGASLLRLAVAAIMLVLVTRPPIFSYSRSQWLGAILLGITTAGMTLCFFAAIRLLPLGLAVAIDFLGPLSVAVIGYGIGWRLVWPLIAGAGVLFLSFDGEQWVGNLTGVLFSVGSGVCWAIYIVLTKKVGAAFKGLEGLAMSMLVAALVSLPFGIADAAPALSSSALAYVLGLAVLTPLLPYALEMVALRRMPASSFGILMSLEPAIAAVAGFLILSQPMTTLQMAGTALVVLASLGASMSPKGA